MICYEKQSAKRTHPMAPLCVQIVYLQAETDGYLGSTSKIS
jgi:hypothetical protein